MNRAVLWGLSLALVAYVQRAEAFPERAVHDRNWGLSAQWISFTVASRPGAQERVQVQVATQNSRCRDPLNRDLCSGSTAFIDLVGHVFSEATGQPVASMTRCLATNRCPTDLVLPSGRYSILLHGGPLSRGAHELLVRVNRTTGGVNVPITQDYAQVSDNIVLDVRDAPANFDLHSVLVSDGPTDVDDVSGSIRSDGNTSNDWVGVDATEAWLFDENFRVLDADLSMSGVGPAALVRRANESRGVPVRYVLVRPYRRPPFVIRRPDNSVITVNNTEYPSVPGAGRMRVVLNDARDTDGDRLSDQVEYELGLCDGRSAIVRTPGMAFRCMLESEVQEVLSSWQPGMPLRAPSDPRDTDGDGLTDAAEVLGTDIVDARMPNVMGGRPADNAPYQRITDASQMLPLWGFDPRHKDVMLEIDRETLSAASCTGATTDCDADRNVYPSPNYPDVGVAFEALWSWRRAFALLPALRVRNPDGRPGIKMHFDVRFAKVRTTSHGFMPQDVPTSTARGRFGEAGFVIHHPLGDTRSMCSCSDRFMSPDPRHGGMARYMVGRMGGGSNTCNQEVDAQVGIPDTVASHEFGHTQGLHHGGPMPDCFANPFARPDATDFDREDKVAFPSHMNYSFDYLINQQSNHNVVRGEVFSVGRNWPLPRWVPTATGAVLGWPELNSYGGSNRTNAVDLWRPKAGFGGPVFYQSMSCGPGSVGMGCIDFNFNRVIERDFVATGVVEPMQAISGAGTFPQSVARFVCDNGGELVDGGLNCCPLGADRDANGRCVTLARTVVPPVGGTVQTLFNMAMQAPFLGRPAAGQARRMYTLFQSDRDATETSGQAVARHWTRTGKIRWLALDKLEITTPDRIEPPCTGYNDDCGRVNAGANSRGDVMVDGQVIPMDGPGRIAAAVLPSSTESEVLMLARASRECPSRTRTVGINLVYEDCDWSPPRFAIGRVADLEAPTGTLRSVTISGAPARMSGVAITAWSPADATPTRFFVVMRDAANNGLLWSSCGAEGACSAAQPLLGDGVPVSSVFSQVALSVQPTSNRLALVYSPRIPLFPNGTLAVSEISGVEGSLRVLTPRPVTQADPSRSPVVMVSESAVSAAFTANGSLTIGFENLLGQGLGTTLSSPFEAGDVLLTVQNKAWNTSRGAVGVTVSLPRFVQTFAPSPGTTYTVFRDDRPAHEALGVMPDGSRNPVFDSNFSGSVRGFGYVIYGGIIQVFFARLDGASLTPRYDYDESATLAYQLCNTIENSSRGLRAADTAIRSSSLGTASKLLCPGAADWPEPPVNRVLPELVWPPRRLRPGEDVERIAAMITGDGWYSAPTHRPHASPSNTVAPVPVNRCTLGDESGAWMQFVLSRPQDGL